jgi:hypothetical protein
MVVDVETQCKMYIPLRAAFWFLQDLLGRGLGFVSQIEDPVVLGLGNIFKN